MSNQEIIDAIKEMTVLELNELVEECEEVFGVSAAAPVAAAGAAAGGEAEQTEFDVILAGVSGSKIKVIKEVRKVTDLGLKDAKGLVDDAPSPVKEGLDKDAAEELKTQLEEAGATIELK